MSRVAIVVHPDRPEAGALGEKAAGWLAERGHQVCRDHGADGDDGCRLDLAISLGGDGTMLRTVDLVDGVPVLGVNVGHLGYLSAVEPAGLVPALEGFFAGRHELEERMTLQVGVDGPGAITIGGPFTALNEAVVEKTDPGHTVRLRVLLGDETFMTYAADALLVATSTGSTAYNLSARGPIVSPELDALVVTPVSPHMLFDRSLVLAPSAVVRLEVLDARAAALVVDGRQVGVVGEGDAVTCRAAASPARLVTFGRRNFHSILKAKFGLADRC